MGVWNNMRKVCAFFGHRDTSSKIEPLIEKQIRRLIIEKGVNTFWIGGYGWFDIYASGILRKLKREYPNIHIVLVAAYIQQLHRGRDNFFDSFDYPAEVEAAPYKLAIPVRNRYMVKNADYIISYIYSEYGGAYEAVIQAKIYKKVVINLANEKI